jgi:hypothetical protein
MITNAMKRHMSANNYARVIKYAGANTNVASHNDERRDAYKGAFNFKDSWGLGVEGFSHGPHLTDMKPLTGSQGELFWVLAFVAIIPILAFGRRHNEDGLASAIGKTTNRY